MFIKRLNGPCIINPKMLKYLPITIEEASGAAAALKGRTAGKGKQVKDLCDLVTVSREYKAMRERAVTEKTEQPEAGLF